MAEPPNVPIGLPAPPKSSGQIRPSKSLKRKRQSPSPLFVSLTPDQKATQSQMLRDEMSSLILYYHEILSNKAGFDLSITECKTVNGMVALLIEESQLPLEKLIQQLNSKLETAPLRSKTTSTMAGVKSAVLLVGQRIMYGVPNLDADVLEDETPSCLWCWETRDLKLMPKSVRSALKVRRECRRRIHERITAVSAMLAVLQGPETDANYRSDLIKATEKLGKALGETDIRSYMDGMLQKNGAEMADKEVKRDEKLLIRQLEKNKRASEKEKRRIEVEVQKEKQRMEKEQKKIQEEAEKVEKRREKEASELQKQSRKKQDEVEKEKRRREKEEAELKTHIAVQKQASIMERFLKLRKTDSKSQNDQSSTDVSALKLSAKDNDGRISMAVTQEMDSTFSSTDGIGIDDIRKSHISSWRHPHQSLHSSRKRHWSLRQKPKSNLTKKLKLTTNGQQYNDDESCIEKLASACGEIASADGSSFALSSKSLTDVKECHRRKQLLQFDKCHRPAFYGIWAKKSNVVGPRHPLRMDPELDYDVDSDEEWEEEDPGESLSDCDKDDEAECLEANPRADDEEESEDGFFVPDGYLSENEGVQIDRMDIDISIDEAKSSPSCTQDSENGEFYALIQKQKHLHKFTETSLRNNQPCFILNIVHEKDISIGYGDLSGKSNFEKMCLQGLSMRAFPGGKPIEILTDSLQEEDQDDCLSNAKVMSKPISSSASAVQELDMLDVISAVQSCSQSIGKIVETLQQKFPTVSKSQLKSKVREISDFVDNRWQVKKEVGELAGVSNSPEVVRKRTPCISAFFSKRCMPPPSGKRSIDSSHIDTLLFQTSEKPDSPVDTPPVSSLAKNQ
ncbi:Chromatin assembly factor 1 subunit FAS1 [Linum grandiflorum]